jgi:hypothetical protein
MFADMPRHVRVEFEGAICHITIRGNGGQDIFGDDHDRERLLRRLAESKDCTEVDHRTDSSGTTPFFV